MPIELYRLVNYSMGNPMNNFEVASEDRYEVKNGILWLDGHPLPFSRGVTWVALVRAGWRGQDGPLSPVFVEKMLRLDRRFALLLMTLHRETPTAA